MIKNVLIMIVFIVFLLPGFSYADSQKGQIIMQRHIEKVKRTKPSEYRKMIERAGDNIQNCISCHQDFGKNTNSSNKINSRSRR